MGVRLLLSRFGISTLTAVGYQIEQLAQIEEEQAPLAPGPRGDFWGITLVCLFVLAVVSVAAVYLRTCMQYRRDIVSMDEGKHAYCGYRLSRLKETLSRLEYHKLDDVDVMCEEEVTG